MPAPTTTGGGLMGYPGTVDTGLNATALLQRDFTGFGVNSAVANQAYFVCMPPIQAQCTITGIRTRCSPGGNGHIDVGVYANNNGLPGLQLAHAAATTTSIVTGNNTVQTSSLIGGGLILSPGIYWLALWIDNITDKPYSTNMPLASLYPVVSGANGANVLPSNAGSLTLANDLYTPYLFGILSGGWS